MGEEREFSAGQKGVRTVLGVEILGRAKRVAGQDTQSAAPCAGRHALLHSISCRLL